MTKENFKSRFISSINKTFKITKKYILDNLPDDVMINLYSRDKKINNLRLTINEAIEKLFIDGKIPKWININIVKVEGNNTIIECVYSDIFLNDDSLLQFSDDPLSPFKPGGPCLPSNWKGLERSEKFHLVEYDEEKGWPKIKG